MNRKNPEFIAFIGPMWSSKTTSMLTLLDRYRHQKKNIVTFKPSIDNRYSETEIVTHNGISIKAISVSEGNDILKHLAQLDQQPNIIAVDELFMIEGIAKVLIWLYRSGFSIVISSLDLSSDCKPFEEVKQILPWTTKIIKCKAVCSVCSADASLTYRRNVEDNNEISVGGADKYEPRCTLCHPKFSQTNR